ncbi:ATP-binding cassette sub- A member 5 [Globomyces sp. JEL0801]|nr:ATP-binding cassette sub- A member 5 [Globomyces sp. JEL0801]
MQKTERPRVTDVNREKDSNQQSLNFGIPLNSTSLGLNYQWKSTKSIVISDHRKSSIPKISEILSRMNLNNTVVLDVTQNVDLYCQDQTKSCGFGIEFYDSKTTGISYKIQTNMNSFGQEWKGYNTIEISQLMVLIDQSLISLMYPDVPINTSKINLKGFLQLNEKEYLNRLNDTFWMVFNAFGSFFFPLTFVSHVSFLVHYLVEEKENRIKEGLQIMGLKSSSYYGSWVLVVLVLAIPSWFLNAILIQSLFLIQSDSLVLILWSLLNGVCLLTFGFLISNLFRQSKYAGIGTCSIIVALSIIGYTVLSVLDTVVLDTILIILITPINLIASLTLIAKQDSVYDAITMSTIFKVFPNRDFSLGGIFMYQILNCVLNLFFAWYLDAVLPSQYGTPKPWNFLFTTGYWSTNTQATNREIFNSDPIYPNNIIIQPQIEKSNVSLKIRNLTKSYQLSNGEKFKAIDNLSFDVMEGQVLAFLGRNGCGKSTTIGILTGLFACSTGDACFILPQQQLILSEQLDSIRKHLGVCPQHDWLWNTLTVQQTLEFYAHLKHLSQPGIAIAVEKTLKSSGLVKKSQALVQTLSGGQRRKLSLCIAFMGDSKFVFLDEMSAGVDPLSRRAMWKIVSENRNGRTIIMTTHFMDEAEILGDNVVILESGTICGIGTPLYLKETVQAGVELTIAQNQNTSIQGRNYPNEWLHIIKQVCDDTKLIGQHENEFVFNVNSQKKMEVAKIFKELDSRKEELAILSYGFSGTTFHDVFHHITQRNNAMGARTSTIPDSVQPELNPSNVVLSQMSALLWKRFKIGQSDLRGTLIPAIMVLILAILVPIGARNISSTCNFSSIDSGTVLKQYPVMKFGNGSLVDKLFPIVSSVSLLDTTWVKSNQTQAFPDATSLNKYILENRQKVISGFDIQSINNSNNIDIIYNKNLYESSLEAINLIHTAMVNQYLKSTGQPISASFQFFSRKSNTAFDNFYTKLGYIFMGFLLVLSMYIPLFSAMVMSKERLSGVRQQQIFSGVSLFIYYVSNLIWDVVVVLFGSAILTLSLMISNFWVPNVIITFTTILSSGIAIILIGYIFARLTTSPSGTVMSVTGYLLMTSFLGFVASSGGDYLKTKNILVAFNPLASFNNMFLVSYTLPCSSNQNNMEPYWAPIFIQWIQIVVFFVLIFIIEFIKGFHKSWKRNLKPNQLQNLDSDIVNEKQRITTEFQTSTVSDQISFRNLSKVFGTFTAVDHLSFGIRTDECFGLLGVNGSGKTTTLRIACGQDSATDGDCIVNGKNVAKSKRAVQNSIGVCAQFDTLFEGLTVRQHLMFYCQLKGLGPARDRLKYIDWLLNRLDLMTHSEKKSIQLSGGNKRKLSFSIAMIGKPPVMIFDEPSTGMDPVSKVFLWNILKDLRKRHTIVLTTHAMEEVTAVCNRIGILVGGQLVALGTQQHLKNKFGNAMEIQVMGLSQQSQLNFNQQLQTKLPGLIILEQYQTTLRYQLPFNPTIHVHIHELFEYFEELKSKFSFQYDISQTSLEQVFIRFAEKGHQLDYEDA